MKFELDLDGSVGVLQGDEAGKRWLCGKDEMNHLRQQEEHMFKNIAH